MIKKAPLVAFSVVLILLGVCFSFVGCSKSTKKKFLIARVSSWDPIDIYGAEKSLSGFLDDILQQIAIENKVEFQVVSGEGQSAAALLQSDHYDGVFSPMALTPSNVKRYAFSEPFFVTGPVVVVNKTSQYKSVRDLKNAEIGMDRNVFYSISDNNPAWILRPFDSVFVALEKVASNQLDGVVLNFVLASRLTRGLYSEKVRMLLPPLVMYSVRLVAAKGEKGEELLEIINSGLKRIKEEGLYDKILSYWGLENATP